MNAAQKGMWEDNDCYVYNNFICYTDKSDSIGAPPPTSSPYGCPNGFFSSKNKQECYQLVDQAMSWTDAQQYCKNQGKCIALKLGWLIVILLFRRYFMVSAPVICPS